MSHLRGSYSFLSLHGSHKVAQGQFMEFPTLLKVSKSIKAMAILKKHHKGIPFENWSGLELPGLYNGSDEISKT